MNCPKCGAELEEGFLYCKKCGEDIHIVPDFEPEIENSIHEILTGVVGDMAAEEHLEKEEPDGFLREEVKRLRRDKASFHILVGAGIGFAVLVLILAAVGAILRFRYFSFDYQMEQANTCMNNENYRTAVEYYTRALELDQTSLTAKYLLAEACLLQKETDRALLLYQEVAAAKGEEEIRMEAVNTVVAICSERGAYQELSDFLISLGDDTVVEGFQKYMAKVPEFSYVEGSYEEVIPLKLTSNTAGIIYYTTDGSMPDENSEVYESFWKTAIIP